MRLDGGCTKTRRSAKPSSVTAISFYISQAPLRRQLPPPEGAAQERCAGASLRRDSALRRNGVPPRFCGGTAPQRRGGCRGATYPCSACRCLLFKLRSYKTHAGFMTRSPCCRARKRRSAKPSSTLCRLRPAKVTATSYGISQASLRRQLPPPEGAAQERCTAARLR